MPRFIMLSDVMRNDFVLSVVIASKLSCHLYQRSNLSCALAQIALIQFITLGPISYTLLLLYFTTVKYKLLFILFFVVMYNKSIPNHLILNVVYIR